MMLIIKKIGPYASHIGMLSQFYKTIIQEIFFPKWQSITPSLMQLTFKTLSIFNSMSSNKNDMPKLLRLIKAYDAENGLESSSKRGVSQSRVLASGKPDVEREKITFAYQGMNPNLENTHGGAASQSQTERKLQQLEKDTWDGLKQIKNATLLVSNEKYEDNHKLMKNLITHGEQQEVQEQLMTAIDKIADIKRRREQNLGKTIHYYIKTESSNQQLLQWLYELLLRIRSLKFRGKNQHLSKIKELQESRNFFEKKLQQAERYIKVVDEKNFKLSDQKKRLQQSLMETKQLLTVAGTHTAQLIEASQQLKTTKDALNEAQKIILKIKEEHEGKQRQLNEKLDRSECELAIAKNTIKKNQQSFLSENKFLKERLLITEGQHASASKQLERHLRSLRQKHHEYAEKISQLMKKKELEM